MAFLFFKKKEDSFDYTSHHVCKNCGSAFQGKFCFRCGEKVVDVSDRSFAKMAESLLNAFTFLEGKFWRSFKLIVTQPGQLSHDIRNGIQVPYMKLVGLFFVANFFYFLFPVFDTFNSSLYSQYHQQDHSHIVQSLVNARIKANQLDVKEFTNQYNAHSGNLAKLLLVVLVFIFTLPLSIVNYSKKNFYFDHLQISFEFHAFQMLLSSVIIPNLLKWIIQSAKKWFAADWSVLLSDNVYSKFSIIIFAYFWIRAQRTFYEHSWWVSVLKGLVLGYIVFNTWDIYRMLLFFFTFYTM
ncbi:MAG: DUF3667 domain-containing protein [Cyclobacteriaceae bacterium]|jgi:hypothetical protein|nr:DUF3667 domain-containing protein [Flammeovirgaceae bacterium]